MLRTWGLTAAYLVGVLLFSSIDISGPYFSPLGLETVPSTDSYEVVGLRAGAVVVGSYHGKYTHGLLTDIHRPQFFRMPFFAAAVPEGGVVEMAVWFLGVIAWTIHLLLRLRPTDTQPRYSSHKGGCG